MRSFLMGIFCLLCSLLAIAQPPCSPVVTLSGNITANRNLDADTVYQVSGCVQVSNGATLTIPAGTVLEFVANSILMIREDGFINATGNAMAPVIMTSGVGSPGSRSVVSNAGLVVVGNAPINAGSTLSLPCSETLTVGSNGASNSGTIRYLQVHYLGGINTALFGAGLTLAGVGSGTILENIQVSHGGLTGINVIGGEPVLTEIVTQDNAENGLFVSYGAQVQLSGYLENRRNTNAHHANGSYGIKVENNTNNAAATPITHFFMTNATILGPAYCNPGGLSSDFKDGISIGNNADAEVYNSVFAGWPANGLYIDGAACIAKTASNDIQFSYNSFFANGTDFDAFPSSVAPTWSSLYGGCNASMALWLSGSGLCAETGNQIGSISDLGYDASICGNYCSPEYTRNFVLTEHTELDPPNGSSIYDDRGAIQFSDLFEWIGLCAEDAVYCAATAFSSRAAQLHFVPNPATNNVIVSFEQAEAGKVQIRILEKVSGNVVRSATAYSSTSGKQQLALPVNGLKEGIYTVQLQTPNQVLYGQLVVK